MRMRRARAADAPAIYRLISTYAAQGLLLPREGSEIREHAANFLVIGRKGQISGCVSLETYNESLAEIRSLAVARELSGQGLGARLVRAAVEGARRRGIAQVFAVTQTPEFFLRQGFSLRRRRSLKEKFERDCRDCPKRRTCRLEAVIRAVLPQRTTLPAHDECAELVSLA